MYFAPNASWHDLPPRAAVPLGILLVIVILAVFNLLTGRAKKKQ